MRDIRAVLGDCEAEATAPRLRPLAPGDVGWIVHRQAVLYHQEYGWDWTYEGLASRILGAFVADSTPRSRTVGSPSAAARSSARFF